MSTQFADDTTKPKTVPFTETITTAFFQIDFLKQHNMYAIEVLYDNQDATNEAILRTVPQGTPIPVPANSLGRIRDELRSYVEVRPDAVTGAGLLTCKLATSAELKRLGLIE